MGAYQIVYVKTKARRRFDCAHYGECLTKAARDLLPGVPCAGCPHYKKDPTTLDANEWFAILSLLQTVFRGDEDAEKSG